MPAAEITKKIWELKEEAKWAPNVEKQMEAIMKLVTFGPAAFSPLEEILSISARNEVRLCCIDAMKSISQNTMTANTDRKSESQTAADNNNKKNEKEENVIKFKEEEPSGRKESKL